MNTSHVADGRAAVTAAIGLIGNPRSHRNRLREGDATEREVDVLREWPRTHDDLERTLREFRSAGIDGLVVDGGDGTVRDVLTAASAVWRDEPLPPIAVVPSGKTNALAVDLGVPDDWTVAAALAALRGEGRMVERAPVEVLRGGGTAPAHRGFLFGAGGFVRATELAQRTHKAGAFHSVAVGLSLGWSILQTAFGSAGNAWRRGETMTMTRAGAAAERRSYYILLASTLERLPLGLKPFGPVRPGMKVLTVDAPPRRVLIAAPVLVAGSQAAWLARNGYRQEVEDGFALEVDGDIILDGEHYRGGALTVRRGAALRFVVP